MAYYARLRLEDMEGNTGEVYRDEGRAERVLAKAMGYLERKDGISVFKKFAVYISDDFAELADALSNISFGKKK